MHWQKDSASHCCIMSSNLVSTTVIFNFIAFALLGPVLQAITYLEKGPKEDRIVSHSVSCTMSFTLIDTCKNVPMWGYLRWPNSLEKCMNYEEPCQFQLVCFIRLTLPWAYFGNRTLPMPVITFIVKL